LAQREKFSYSPPLFDLERARKASGKKRRRGFWRNLPPLLKAVAFVPCGTTSFTRETRLARLQPDYRQPSPQFYPAAASAILRRPRPTRSAFYFLSPLSLVAALGVGGEREAIIFQPRKRGRPLRRWLSSSSPSCWSLSLSRRRQAISSRAQSTTRMAEGPAAKGDHWNLSKAARSRS